MTPTIRYKNGVLTIDNTPLVAEALQETHITADLTAASSSTLTVRSITGFAVNQLLLIEELGNENAEIVKTHASSAPSGSTVTLTTTVARNHSAGTKVYIIAYDQIHLSQDDNSSGTSKTNLTTTLGTGLVAIQPDTRIQSFKVADTVEGYFFARYKDSIAGTFSDYADALISTGWARNTVGYLIDNALRELNLSFSEKLHKTDCYVYINECLREITGKQMRWPEHFNFNYALATITAGDYQYALPSDIYDSESNRSILGVRIGKEGTPLAYLDPIDFEEEMDNLAETTAAEAGSVGETDIDLTNAADFASSGTVTYFVSGVKYTFTYTSKSSNTLSGIPASGTGSITQAFSSGDTMYQNAILSDNPTFYTIREGSLDIAIPSATIHGKQIWLDYAMVVTSVDSDGDAIDLHRYDILLNYLIWRIDAKINKSNTLDMNNGYYTSFRTKLNDAIRTSPHQLKTPFRPRVNMMRKH